MRRGTLATLPGLCLLDLNLDVLLHILSYLEQPSLLRLAQTSKAWYDFTLPGLLNAVRIRRPSSAERLLVLLDNYRPLFHMMRSLEISIHHQSNRPREKYAPLLRAAVSILCAAPLLTRLVLDVGPFDLPPEEAIHRDMEKGLTALDKLQELRMDDMVPWISAILVRTRLPLTTVNVFVEDLSTLVPVVNAAETLKTLTLRLCTLPENPPVFPHVERVTLSNCEIPGTDLSIMFPGAQHVELQGSRRPHTDATWNPPVREQRKTWHINKLVADHDGLGLVAGYTAPSVVVTHLGAEFNNFVRTCPNLERLSLTGCSGNVKFYTDTLPIFFEGSRGDFMTITFTYDEWARIAVNLSSVPDALRSYATRFAKRFAALGQIGLFLRGVAGAWPAVFTVEDTGGKRRKLTRMTAEEAQRVWNERVEGLSVVPVEDDGQIHIYFDKRVNN